METKHNSEPCENRLRTCVEKQVDSRGDARSGRRLPAARPAHGNRVRRAVRRIISRNLPSISLHGMDVAGRNNRAVDVFIRETTVNETMNPTQRTSGLTPGSDQSEPQRHSEGLVAPASEVGPAREVNES